MSIFNALSLLGGLALFLYGMEDMGNGLTQTAGGKLEKILARLTSSPFKGMLLGLCVTGIIQSSSATTVMVVGLVNSGMMQLSQAIGVIMGANIGTTVTSWILSLTGISSSNIWVQMLKPSSFTPVLAAIGICMIMFSKSEKKHSIAHIMLGFAILMTGMDMMSSAVTPLASDPNFTRLFVMFKNPLLGVAVGAGVTAIIQSSSASVGILQALAATGTVSFGAAIPIILGQNIGTCVTAMISAAGANRNAKRAAFVHLYFNLIGTTLFLIVFYSVNAFAHFAFLGDPANAVGIAIFHSSFNIVTTAILLPCAKLLEKLATLTLRDRGQAVETAAAGDQELKLLDPRFLSRPGFAAQQCHTVGCRMAELVEEEFSAAVTLLTDFDHTRKEDVIKLENRVDSYEDQLGEYLVKLSGRELNAEDSRTVSILLHSIGDLERMADRAVNIAETAESMQKKELQFSEEAKSELLIYTGALTETLELSVQALESEDGVLASRIEPMKGVCASINNELKERHIERLQKGICTIQLGVMLEDLLMNFGSVSDHCSNIGLCIRQIEEQGMATHEELERMQEGGDDNYNLVFRKFQAKYELP